MDLGPADVCPHSRHSGKANRSTGPWTRRLKKVRWVELVSNTAGIVERCLLAGTKNLCDREHLIKVTRVMPPQCSK